MFTAIVILLLVGITGALILWRLVREQRASFLPFLDSITLRHDTSTSDDSVIVTLEPATVRSGLPVTQQHVRSARRSFDEAVRSTEAFMTKFATAYLDNAQQVARKNVGAQRSPLQQSQQQAQGDESRVCSPLYTTVLLMELAKATGDDTKRIIRRALGVSDLDNPEIANGVPTPSQYRERLNVLIKFTAIAFAAKVTLEEARTEELRLFYEAKRKRHFLWDLLWLGRRSQRSAPGGSSLFLEWDAMYKPMDLFSVTFWFNKQEVTRGSADQEQGQEPERNGSPTQTVLSGGKDVVDRVRLYLAGSYNAARDAEGHKPVRTIEPMVGELKPDNSGQGLAFLATDFVCSLGGSATTTTTTATPLASDIASNSHPTFKYRLTSTNKEQECFMLPIEEGSDNLFYLNVGEGELVPGEYEAPNNIYGTNTALCVEIPFAPGHDMNKWPLHGFRFVLRILMPTKSHWYAYPANRVVEILTKWNDVKKKMKSGSAKRTSSEVWSYAQPRTLILPRIDLALPAEDITKVLADCQLSGCFGFGKTKFTAPPSLQPHHKQPPATLTVKPAEANAPPGEMYLSSVGNLARVAFVPSPFAQQPADWTTRLKETDAQVRISETFYFGVFCQPVYDSSKTSNHSQSIPLQIGYIVQ